MADFRARQRVAIHDGTDEFGVASSKPLFVQLSDGTDVALINASGQVAVEVGNTVTIQDGGNSITVDGNVGITGSVTVVATDLDIRDIDAAQDNIAISDGTDTLAVNADGSINAVVSATNLDIRDLSSASDSVAAVQSGTWNIGTLTSITNAVTIQDGGNVISIDDAGGSITVDGAVTVSATDLDIRDLTHVSDSVKVGDGTDLLAVNADGSINVVVAGASGTAIHNHDTSAAVAKDASDNHDYTVSSGKTMKVKQIIVAASGAMKITLQAGPLASLVTYGVWFTSGAKPTEVITLEVPISVPDTSTGTVRVIRRNDDSQAMDVYSTIIGEEV
jgi:hypothetical protein